MKLRLITSEELAALTPEQAQEEYSRLMRGAWDAYAEALSVIGHLGKELHGRRGRTITYDSARSNYFTARRLADATAEVSAAMQQIVDLWPRAWRQPSSLDEAGIRAVVKDYRKDKGAKP